MKTLIILSLFFISALFTAFAQYEQSVNPYTVDTKFEKYFTGYNPDFKSKGIIKSAFKHEVIHNP